MHNLRVTILLTVLGGLTVSIPVSAKPADIPPATQSTPSNSTEDFQATQSDSAPGTESDVATQLDVAKEPGIATESDVATEFAVATEPDVAIEPGIAIESDIATQPGVATESDPPIKSNTTQSANSPNLVRASFLVSTIYNFRGLNVFKETSQADQNALFSPSITTTVFHPDLWLKYAGFFQIDGDNRGYLVDSGVGAEQDIAVGFDLEFTNKLMLSTSLTYFFYPFALSRITGVKWPSYLEPAVGINYKTDKDIRLGLQISYFAPIQKRIRDQRYMYTLLTVGKKYQFLPKLALDFDLSFGYKLFADPSILQDTIFDMEFCVSLPYTVVNNLQLVPSTHAAWAYLYGRHFGDQYMIYFSLDLVVNF